MILLTAHTDVVRHDIPLTNTNGTMKGLLDNFAGIVCLYSAIYQNKSLQLALKKGDLKIFHSNHEEFGYDQEFPELNPETDYVINIDVCAGKRYKDLDGGIENYWGTNIAHVLDTLEWEGFKFYFCTHGSVPDEEDEMDQWIQKGISGLSFIIPIECPNDNWHGKASISMEQMTKSILFLQRLICYLL